LNPVGAVGTVGAASRGELFCGVYIRASPRDAAPTGLTSLVGGASRGDLPKFIGLRSR
jgi:hypothetical protein